MVTVLLVLDFTVEFFVCLTCSHCIRSNSPSMPKVAQMIVDVPVLTFSSDSQNFGQWSISGFHWVLDCVSFMLSIFSSITS
jgi:hypothetical protein